MNASPGAGPQLYRPRPDLANHIEFFGYWERESGDPHRSRALPRGAATVIIDVSGRHRVDFFAGDGRTRLDVPPAFIAGAGTESYITRIDAAQAVMTIHFRPGGALPFLGVPLGELENACVGLDRLWGMAGESLHARLIAAHGVTDRVEILESFLVQRAASHDVGCHRGVAAALSAFEAEPSMRVARAGELTGLSPKRLAAAFRAEVGLAPKAYQRVRRLQAALSRLDAGPVAGASLAADLGYFDQAHFVREFTEFTAMTPTEYVRRRSWLPSHVDVLATA